MMKLIMKIEMENNFHAVDTEVSNADLQLPLKEFNDRILMPMVSALKNEIEEAQGAK